MDITVISDKKLDEFFPINQFLIQGFANPTRFDRACVGGSILRYYIR